MDKTTKIILIVLASIFILCICASLALVATGLTTFGLFRNSTSNNVTMVTGEGVRVGAEIADYQVPDGYNSAYYLHFGNIIVIGHDSASKKAHIILAQFPDGTSINFDEIYKLIQEGSNTPGSIWYDGDMKTIDRIPVTINGQDTTLIINEGESSDGETYRMATANFEGRGGPAVLIVVAPLDEWDMQIVDQMILSTN
jgi:hypothetical protein